MSARAGVSLVLLVGVVLLGAVFIVRLVVSVDDDSVIFESLLFKLLLIFGGGFVFVVLLLRLLALGPYLRRRALKQADPSRRMFEVAGSPSVARGLSVEGMSADPLPSHMTMSIDDEGLVAWAGTLSPVRLGRIRWEDVVDVGSPSTAAISLRMVDDVDVQLNLQEVGWFAFLPVRASTTRRILDDMSTRTAGKRTD